MRSGSARALVRARDCSRPSRSRGAAAASAPPEQRLAAPAARATLARSPTRSSSGSRPARDAIEPFHDRMRSAVIAHIPDDAQRRTHGLIAHALEQLGASAAALLERFEAAGEQARARTTSSPPRRLRSMHSRSAAPPSCTCAHSPRRAIPSGAPPCSSRSPTHSRTTAARRTPPSATSSRGARSSDETRQLDLLRRAAERFLMAGRLDRGLATARSVLARVDMTLPTTRVRTALGIVWNQLRMRRALEWKPRTVVDPRALHADICWSIGAGLGRADRCSAPISPAARRGSRSKSGTPHQIARSFVVDDHRAAVLGRRDRADRLPRCCTPRRRGRRHADRVVVRAHDALHDRVPARSPVPALPRARDRARSRVARRRLRRGLGDRHHPPLQPRVAADARHDVRARRAGRSADHERGAHGRQVPGGLAARAVRGAPPARRQAGDRARGHPRRARIVAAERRVVRQPERVGAVDAHARDAVPARLRQDARGARRRLASACGAR